MVYFAKQQARSWHKIPIGNRILESDSLPLPYHVGYQLLQKRFTMLKVFMVLFLSLCLAFIPTYEAKAAGIFSAIKGISKARKKAIARQIVNNDHSFKKHKSEFLRGRSAFKSKKTISDRVPLVGHPKIPKKYTRSYMIGETYKTISSGKRKNLSGQRQIFYRNGTVVIYNPKAKNHGTVMKPIQGKAFFDKAK